jgi:hypothetical protein
MPDHNLERGGDGPSQCMSCQGTGMDTAGRMYKPGDPNPNAPTPLGRPVATVWAGTRCRHCRGTGWLHNGPANPPEGTVGGPWRADPR